MSEQIIKPQVQEKRDAIQKIREKIEKSSAFYVAKYEGVNVEGMTELRKALLKEESELKVFKNTLFKLAIDDKEYAEDFNELLKGPNAIAFAYGEPTITAKTLFDFAKKNKVLKIKGCLFENEFFGSDKISIIKDLPSRSALLSMIASVINEPMAKLARTLDALRENKENQS